MTSLGWKVNRSTSICYISAVEYFHWRRAQYFCDEVDIAKESEAYIRVFLVMMASWRYYEISDRSFTRYLYKFLASFAAKSCPLARWCVKRLCMVGFWYRLLVTYWYCFHFDDFQIARFMGPMWGLTWGLMAPCGTHIDPINFAILVDM